MIIAQDPEDIRNAQLLQSKCELKRVALHHCHVSVEGVQEAMKIPFSLRLSHNTVAHVIVDSMLRIEASFQVQCFDSSEQHALLFDVNCAFDLDYEIQDRAFQPSAESIAAFKDGNAVFNCWPYTREFVQNLTSRMLLQPPPIPLLRITPKLARQASQPTPIESKKST